VLFRSPGGVFNSKVPGAVAKPQPPECVPLAAGHRRRLYFANPNADDGAGAGLDREGNAIFGLGYEEIDQNGVPVPGTFVDVHRFDPTKQLCIPLAAGQMPVREVWELWNLSTELHNFHIHQTKFRKIDPKTVAVTNPLSRNAPQPGIAEDTVPLPYATPGAGSQPALNPDAVSCTVDDVKAGRCAVTPIYVDIPFVRIGTFVAHCHVLEHEDGGMMGVVRVVPSSK
jgi:FtsP/CotA-like multicopper oxidase with cupredoxin domain